MKILKFLSLIAGSFLVFISIFPIIMWGVLFALKNFTADISFMENSNLPSDKEFYLTNLLNAVKFSFGLLFIKFGLK